MQWTLAHNKLYLRVFSFPSSSMFVCKKGFAHREIQTYFYCILFFVNFFIALVDVMTKQNKKIVI
jgi:hypothetical protein